MGECARESGWVNKRKYERKQKPLHERESCECVCACIYGENYFFKKNVLLNMDFDRYVKQLLWENHN